MPSCVNHPANPVQAYCQHCGKGLCTGCVRTTPAGQIFCDACMATTAGGTTDPIRGSWTGTGFSPSGFPAYGSSAPNPSTAAVLGLIPGVGAMYNGQLFKGLIHVVVFAVLVSIADRYPIFGLFIAAWILYQSFEAYQTAKARRDGQPLPDPFGLNELGIWLNLGIHGRPTGVPPAPSAPPPPNPGYSPNPANPGSTAAAGEPPVYNAPYSALYTSSWTSSQYAGPASDPASYGQPGSQTGPYSGATPPQPPPYAEPWSGAGADPYAPNYPPGAIPPIPPIPPYSWRRKEPVFAFVLIGLGIVFLLQSMGFVAHMLHYIWPLALIGLGVWLILRRVSDSQGGSK